MNGIYRCEKEHPLAEWKRLPLNFSQNYLISNTGLVYSLKTNKYLCCKGDKNGYYRVSIPLQNKTAKTMKIHRLVLITFSPNKDQDRLVVNHKDGNKTNNNIENLEWCTNVENIKHATLNGLRGETKKGCQSPHSTISEKDIYNIVNKYLNGLPTHEIAESMSLSYCVVREIIYFKRYIDETLKYKDEIIKYRESLKKLTQEKKEEALLKKRIKNINDLTKEQLNNFYDDFAKGKTFDKLAKKFGKNKSVIDSIIRDIPTNSPYRKERILTGKTYQSGTKNGRSKLTPEQVLEIVDKFNNKGFNKSQLSREYKISRAVIQNIIRGTLWSSVTKIVKDN